MVDPAVRHSSPLADGHDPQSGPGVDPEVASLRADNARLRRLLEEAGQNAERGMVLLARADEEHLRIEERLEQSRRDLTILSETIPQLVWRSHDDGNWTWGSTQWTAYTGQSDPESHGRGWLQIVHPDDRERTLQAWHAADAEGGLSVEHRLRRAADGVYRWFQTRSTPLRDAAGRTVEWFGTSTEVHALKTLQEQQAFLLAELQHRVRNTLAVMRAIARRTAETSESVEAFGAHLDGRYNAFSRVQGAVTRDPSAGLSLHSLVAEELLACQAREGEQVQITGPEIILRPQAAETLGLALHELATNAIEHGALAKPHGRIQIAWRVEADGEGSSLLFVWAERGLQDLPPAPQHRGFGLNLLENTLRYELQAKTVVSFAPSGLRCTLQLPLTERVLWSGTASFAGVQQ